MGGGGPGDAGGSLAARRALADPELRHFDLAGFELDCGVRLPEGATLAYRVHGPPIDASHEGSNRVILHPTAFDGVHDELEFQIGPDETLDTDVFTVVTANMLGNGVSFSPSMMTADRQNKRGTMTPPPITVADNVRAQHQLMTELLGGPGWEERQKLAAVYGYSMGALQAFEYAVAFPDAAERIIAVCGAARCGDLNGVFLDSMEAALLADASTAYGGASSPADQACFDAASQRFVQQPVKGLETLAKIYAGWGVGARFYLDREYERAGFSSAASFVDGTYVQGFASCDANDLLSMIRTWKSADVSRHAVKSSSDTGPAAGPQLEERDDSSLARALARIKADVLLLPAEEDRYFTLAEALREEKFLKESAQGPGGGAGGAGGAGGGGAGGRKRRHGGVPGLQEALRAELLAGGDGTKGLQVLQGVGGGATARNDDDGGDEPKPDAEREKQKKRKTVLATIISPAGHRAGNPHLPELDDEKAFLRQKVRDFLGLDR